MKKQSLRDLSDKEFEKRFNQYGQLAKLWNRRFAGLLPEAKRRKMYEKRGCTSIAELATKTGSLNWQQVRTVLETDNKLEGKPQLRQLLEDGEVAASKLNVIANIATGETDGQWATKIRELSWKALQELKKEVRKEDDLSPEDIAARELGYFPRPEFLDTNKKMIDLLFEPLVAERFLSFREDYATRKRKSVTMSDALGTLMNGYSEETQNPPRFEQVLYVDDKRDLYLTPTRWGLVAVPEEKRSQYKNKGPVRDLPTLLAKAKEIATTATNRNIPEAIKAFVRAKFGGFCAFPGCHRRGKIFHHIYRWALVKKHDPEKIALLCKNHEELAHAGLIKNELEKACKWQIQLERKVKTPEEAARARIDAKVKSHRR